MRKQVSTSNINTLLKSLWNWINANIIQISIFLSVAAYILINSYLCGYFISPDSSNYLREAQTLLNGNGFYYNAELGAASFWSTWPIGYPFLIALTAFITHADVYLASKILTIVILAIINIIFYRRFKDTAWVYCLITLNAGLLTIFSYTWSEQPFILGLIWFVFAIYDILRKEKPSKMNYISLGAVVPFLFLSRYIGGFALGVLGLVFLYLLYDYFKTKEKPKLQKTKTVFFVTIIDSIIIFGYFAMNYLITGHIGGGRSPAPESMSQLVLTLIRSEITEMQNIFAKYFSMTWIVTVLLWVLLAGITIYLIVKYTKEGKEKLRLPLISISLGIIYSFAIVFMRFVIRFDPISYRFLLPATVLFCIGFISLSLANDKICSFVTVKNKWVRYIIALVLCLGLLYSPVHGVVDQINSDAPFESGYAKSVERVLEKYDGISHVNPADIGGYYSNTAQLLRFNRLDIRGIS